MRKMLCAIALCFCVVALSGSTPVAEASGGYSTTVRGTYQFTVRGVFHFRGSREAERDSGSLEIKRSRIDGTTNWNNGEQVSFGLRLNQPVNDRKRVQRRVGTGTFTMRSGNRTTRGTGRVSFKLIKKRNGSVLMKGTYVINWNSGQYAGARSTGRINGIMR